MDHVDKLMCFGLTRQEATLYLTLYAKGELTGYEAAKVTGISRSNAYNALAGLADKGAAYLIEGDVTKYIPVAVAEFCGNKLRYLSELEEQLHRNMPKLETGTEGYVTITGKSRMIDKIKNMLTGVEERVYLSMAKDLLLLIREEVISLSRTGKKVVVITEQDIDIPGVRIYQKIVEDGRIRVIVDSKYVLTGEINEEESSCLYSGKKDLIDVFTDALRNEMKLIEITKGARL